MARKKQARRVKPDRLMTELERIEEELREWTQSSPENQRLFEKDPLQAMRSAGLDIEDDIMLELQTITRSIARKLK